jgi:hypothetical protein
MIMKAVKVDATEQKINNRVTVSGVTRFSAKN